jgi:hypothetical protein
MTWERKEERTMNRIISAIALACVGAGAVLGWQTYRQLRSSGKADADIDRWEEEGGHLLPARQATASASARKPG